MNDRNPLRYKQATYLIIGVCGLLFSLFSFSYLYVFQADLIEALHYSLAQGRTHYSPLVGAIIITGVLLIFRWGINKLLGLKGVVRSLAYFPSCLLLGVLTDVHRSVYHGSSFAEYWQWLLPLILLVYVGVAFALRRAFRQWLDSDVSMGALWNSNLCILLACMCMTVAIGNTDGSFHRELRVEKCLRQGDYQTALKTGRYITKTTHTLTALRAYALSLNGSMGESLFAYPQYYGSEGLVFPEDRNQTLRMDNDSLAVYLGGPRKRGEAPAAYFERQFNASNGRYTVFDYYLCSLLLDKRLDKFMQEAERNLDAESMPCHYREAIALYKHLHPGYQGFGTDREMEKRLKDFLTQSSQFASEIEGKNHMRRIFGDTYWWYFRYQ